MRRELLLAAVLAVVGFAVYLPDLKNPFFLDDVYFIVENTSVHELSLTNARRWFSEDSFASTNKPSNYYRPVMTATFALNYAVGGLEPFGYHLANNLIHVINGLLVFWLILYLFKKRWLAFLVALIFLIHPMQSEGVAYVAGRGDLLSSLFILAGLLVWLKGIELKKPLLTFGASGILLVLALLSRESGIVFPFLAIVIYVACVSRETVWRALKDVFKYVWPHLLIVAGYFALRFTILDFDNILNFGRVDVATAYGGSIVVRAYTFASVLLEYLRTFFLPINVHERLSFHIEQSFFEWPVWFVFLCLIGLIACLILLYKRRSADFRLWFFSLGWFFVALAPSSGIIPTNLVIQDHRLYLVVIGLSVFCFVYLAKGLEYLEKAGNVSLRLPALAALLLYLIFLGSITVERAIIWGKPIELLEETLRFEPKSILAYDFLGDLYFLRGDYENAGRVAREALRAGSPSPIPHYILGEVYQFAPSPDLATAIEHYQKAININPTYKAPYQRLAGIYIQQESEEALYYLKKLNELDPTDAEYYYGIAFVYRYMGNSVEALAWAQKGLTLATDDREAERYLRQIIAELTAP